MFGCRLLAGFYGGRAWGTLHQNGDMNTVVMWYGKGNGNLFLYTVRQLVGYVAFWLSVAVAAFLWGWVRSRRALKR